MRDSVFILYSGDYEACRVIGVFRRITTATRAARAAMKKDGGKWRKLRNQNVWDEWCEDGPGLWFYRIQQMEVQ